MNSSSITWLSIRIHYSSSTMNVSSLLTIITMCNVSDRQLTATITCDLPSHTVETFIAALSMMSVTLWSITAIHYTDIQQYATNIKNTLASTNHEYSPDYRQKIFELRLAEKYLSPVQCCKIFWLWLGFETWSWSWWKSIQLSWMLLSCRVTGSLLAVDMICSDAITPWLLSRIIVTYRNYRSVDCVCRAVSPTVLTTICRSSVSIGNQSEQWWPVTTLGSDDRGGHWHGVPPDTVVMQWLTPDIGQQHWPGMASNCF